MASNGLLPELFHRRLVLLSLLALAGIVPVTLRLGYLTLYRGGELRKQAESRLTMQRWEPTIRGKILDRKGRVLATDRPSFDIAVEYPVITGQWAYEQGGTSARKAAGARWRQMSPVQREQLVSQWAAQYKQQLDAGWKQFAKMAGISDEELDERRSAVIAEVSRQATNVREAMRESIEAEINKGFELTEDLAYTEVPTASIETEIREERSWHVLVHDVSDEVAFQFPLMTSTKAPTPDAQTNAQAATPRFWMPGLHLIDGSGREYPNETMQVLVDRRSFPGPLKSNEPLLFTVRGVMTQVVGWMRSRPLDQDYWWQEQVRDGADGGARRTADDQELHTWASDRSKVARDTADAGAYLAGESVGATGIEWALEQVLRGRRGSVTEKMDTGEVERTERVAGLDARLTIDAQLQSRIMALMSPGAGLAVVQPWQKNKAQPEGTTLNGAAVVIEVDTGDILAMVSTPTYSREQVRSSPDSIFKDLENQPSLSRAFARPYAPGSIVKPLMYNAAVASGVVDAYKMFDCTGHLFPDQLNVFRCWIYKQPPHITHTQQLGGPLDVTSAIMASCNIYFFNIGRLLGPERIGQWYEKFGVGQRAKQPRLGLGAQYSGSPGRLAKQAQPEVEDLSEQDREEMGAPEPVRRTGVTPGKGGLSLSESILMGIGQGPIAWTPLHAADAYATLARGGVRIVPRIMADEAPVVENLGLDPRAVELSLEGLRRAVSEDRGTGHHITLEGTGGASVKENIFNAPGVTVWGKSGTADSGFRARDSEGRPITDDKGRPVSVDHAWFVVLVGNAGGRPKYAVSLLVERGGSGGRVSGPLCNQIIHALIEEGYLGNNR